LPLAHGACFRTERDGIFSLQEVLSRLGDMPDAASRMQQWGWRDGSYRVFACDGPPKGEAGWVEINLHRFADAASAWAAVDYFATARSAGTMLMRDDSLGVGDHAVALTGPAVNGKEFTIYASQGPVLLRVTGVSPSGIPFMNVLAVAQSVLAMNAGTSPVAQAAPAPPQAPPPPQPALAATAYLPRIPAVHHADCFQVSARGTYDYGDIVAAFAPLGLTTSQIAALGWTDGAYVVFSCADPPFGRANQLDIVIHQFQDAPSAQRARPYASDMYVPGVNETRSCDTAGTLVICVTGHSLSGSPLSDVQFVLMQVIESAR
jgi:hypothetical protein